MHALAPSRHVYVVDLLCYWCLTHVRFQLQVTLDALGEMFKEARCIMSWLGDCAKVGNLLALSV